MKMKTANLSAFAKDAASRSRAAAKRASVQFSSWQIPNSMNWLFSLGFKIGLFLALKSFLILRYQGMNLTLQGIVIVLSQLLLGFVLIVCGMLMQDLELYASPFSIRKISGVYGITGLLCALVMAFRVAGKWEFFKDPVSVNWFIDFFAGLFKGAKEITLSILFVDCDLWVAFCLLLFLASHLYLNVKFAYQDSFCGKLIQRIPALKAAQLSIAEASENMDADEN